MLSVSALALLVFALPAAATSSKSSKDDPAKGKSTEHNLKSPMAKKQDALRATAIQMKLRGKADGKVVKVAKGQYVELAREGTDRIFTIIAEFGNARHSAYPDQNSDGSPASDALTFEGPLHNSIPRPDRTQDNTTVWQADFNKAHYENMYFNRMAKYWESQSSGRYSITGDINGWVKVPFNEARYGRDFCGGIVCNNTWFLIRDAMAYWVKGQLDANVPMATIQSYLKTFDVEDRYDSNGNGNFDEPDGFIDHFQIVHAGGDQAAGDPYQGSDAIWSHRWYAAVSGGGPNGYPGINAGQGGPSGGLPGGIPENKTGVWIGDYTVQPENGGLGVFVHEFGHDAMGFPDLYDTSGNTGGAENSTGFWTLMSSGANIGDGSLNGIGDAPTDLGAWEKFQVGWLGCTSCPGGKFYDVAFAGSKSEHQIGPSNQANKKGQALFVVLPDKTRVDTIGAPKSGQYAFYSSQGDNISTTMSKTVSSGGTLTAQLRYEAEETYDFGFVEASTDGGTTFTPIVNNLSSSAADDQSGINSSGAGIDGSSGGQYVQLTATLPAGTNAVRFRYTTDGGVAEAGFLVDDVTLNGVAIGTAETATEGWVFNGWRRTTGTETSEHFNAYVGEYRNYRGYDTSLKTAYNFGFLNTKPDWVETFPYQDGLLISYWDESFGDNNVGDHPGGGLLLPVDARPRFSHSYDGHLLRPRILTFDSTFGLDATDAITVHKNGQATTIPSQPAVPVFDDRNDYWFNSDEHGATGVHVGRYQPGWYSVKVPKTGTQIRVKSTSAQGNFMNIEVSPAK